MFDRISGYSCDDACCVDETEGWMDDDGRCDGEIVFFSRYGFSAAQTEAEVLK